MKLFIVTITSLFLFSACSSRSNAFDFFQFDANYENAISYTRTASVMQSFETNAIISTVYLNKVLPEEYSDKDSFFVALYIKDGKKFYTEGKAPTQYKLELNGQDAINIEVLKKKSNLRNLMPIKNEWNRYYLVEFPKTEENNLTLKFSNDINQSVLLQYKKEEF